MFHGLRQQAEKDNSKEPYICLSDFIAPKVHSACEHCHMNGSVNSGLGTRLQVLALASATWGFSADVLHVVVDRPPMVQHCRCFAPRVAATTQRHVFVQRLCRSAAVR